MKKLVLGVAVLAIACISLVSFTSHDAPEATSQQTYIWIKYDCSTGQVATFSTGTNVETTFGPNFPSSWTNTHFTNCKETGFTTCAVRFVPGEFEPIPGLNGHLRPKAGVNPFDGSHMRAYCF